MSKKNLTTYMLLIVAIVILVNILSDMFFVRLDLTEDQRYTMSDATKDILENLPEPVTITAYFSEDLPPDIMRTRRDFQELLIEYVSIANGMVDFQFIDPGASPEMEQEAMQAGVQPVLVNRREKDKVEQQKVYLGASIAVGEKTDIIPFMKPGAAMEYALSSSIKKLTVTNKPTVGLLQGHGEPKLSEFQQVRTSLNVLYNVEEVSLSDSTNAIDRFETVAIIAPTDSFPQSHLQQLDNFLAAGKNLVIGFNKVELDLTTNQGKAIETNLGDWLASHGLMVDNNFVIDLNCARATVPQRFGNFNLQTQIPFPYVPIVNTFEEHPITKGLEAVVFEYVSTLNYTGDTTKSFSVIATSSKKSGIENVPTFVNVQKRWSDRDFPESKLPVAGILEGKIVGNNSSRIVLFADGNFPVNGEGQSFKQIQPDNASLLVNAIDWLSDDTGLIELRTKGVSMRPLDDVDEGKRTFLKWLNFMLPILLIIIYGVIRSQMRRNRKIRRMQQGYIS